MLSIIQLVTEGNKIHNLHINDKVPYFVKQSDKQSDK